MRKILTLRPSLASYHNRTQLRTGTLPCSPRPLGCIPIKSPHSAVGTPCPCASPSHTTPKSHIFYLSINQHSPPSNTHTFSAGYFEWSGKLFGSPPTPATISFGRNCLLLLTENSKIAEFPFPTAAEALIEARGFGLRPVSGSHFFARPSHGIGHKHPIRSSTPNPPPPLPLLIQRWPASSPATTSPDLPEYEEPSST